MRTIALVGLLSIAQAMVVDVVAQSSPIWTIGGEDAIGTELGNRVRTFQLPNHLLIIERDAPFLKLVTTDGRVRQQIGRLGGGPGEFRQPSMAYYDSTRRELLVVDGAAVRVSVYAIGDSLRFLRSLVAPEPRLEGLCLLRGKLFGLVSNAPTMLREFALEGERLVTRRAFAEPKSLHPLAAVPALRNQASGVLICDEREAELVVVSRNLGEVHRIDVDGRRHSVDSLPGFKPMTFTVIDGRLVAEFRHGDTYDRVFDVVSRSSNVNVVVDRVTRTSQGTRLDGYRSYSLSTLNAASPPSPETWVHVAAFGSQVVCLREEPVPTLAMFSGRRCPSQ